MSNQVPTIETIYYGPLEARYSIVKDTTPLSRFYTVSLEVYHLGNKVVSDELTLTVCLHLTKGYYSTDLDEYLDVMHNRVKSYIWATLIEEDFGFKNLLCGQAHVLLKRVGNNLLESLYQTKPS